MRNIPTAKESSRAEAKQRSNLVGQTYFRKSICAAGSALIVRLAIAGAAVVPPLQSALAQFIEQGPKLVGTGNLPEPPSTIYSVALSADGNTAIIGVGNDNQFLGAAWVFIRSGGVWSQQGSKLVGTGAAGSASTQGSSVALSADGNTAIVGGSSDNNNTGAVWTYTRSGGVWTQLGGKLVGTGGAAAQQGTSVALSADGNTAIVGGSADTSGNGAVWVYTRGPSGWSQQGAKLTGDAGSRFGSSVALSADGNIALIGEPAYNSNGGAVAVFGRSSGVWTLQNGLVGSGNVGAARQGTSVALSADGTTAIVGGLTDNSNAGAAWVFIRNGTSWFQQGMKLFGTGAIGTANQGQSVGLSADGNTAMVGGPGDNSALGAAWAFTRSGTAWTQLGGKLVGAGNTGQATEGYSVALSGDGQTGISGGYNDNSNAGAAWVFVRSRAATHDFNGNYVSDIAWRDGNGNVAFWIMNGAAVSSTGGIGGVPGTWSILGQRDFDGDGKADLLWHDTSGNTAMWFMNGAAVGSTASVGNIPTTWSIAGVGDFNGDGLGDIIWRDTSGNVAMWLMNGAALSSGVVIGNVPLTWNIVGTGDYNGDGKSDLLWRDNLGNNAMWFMNGTQVVSTGSVGNVPATTWSVVGTGDFNGDGKSDIVWRDTSGNTSIWLMNGATVSSAVGVGSVPTTWSIALVGDFSGDGMSDLLWRDTGGNTAMWFMNGVSVSSTAVIGNIPTIWTVQSVNAE